MTRDEFFEEWVTALESGEFKQTIGALRKRRKGSEYAYCCLGVCHVVSNRLGYEVVTDKYIEEGALLSRGLARRLGIDVYGGFKTPIRHGGKLYVNLIGLNDRSVRFKTIARIIRKQRAADNFVLYEAKKKGGS